MRLKVFKPLSFLLLFVLLSVSSIAQGGLAGIATNKMVDPVSWTQETKKISDTEYLLIFKATADEHWHFYSQYTEGTMPMAFYFDDIKGYELLGKPSESPKPTEEFDELLGGLTKYWDKTATFKQKIKITSSEEANIHGAIEFQACIDGACTLLTYDFKFTLAGITKKTQVEEAKPAPKNTEGSQAEEEVKVEGSSKSETIGTDTSIVNNDNTLEKSTVAAASTNTETTNTPKKKGPEGASQGMFMIFLFAFLAGMLTLITPCVFPMIPMTVSFFMKGQKSRAAGLKQAYFFGFSIVAIFAVLGLALTLLLGKDAMYIISTHWIPNTLFFIIFMVFALSFFGMFELTLPSSLINKSDENADRGGYVGTFFVAFTTVLVSFSCTGPILGAALIELSSGSDNSIVFFISMIGFALGFAIPFTLLAMFPSVMKKLKSGSWLNTVKIVFGFIEIALGLKFLSMADLGANWGLLDRETFLALWIVTFSFLGFYLLGKLKFKGDSDVPVIGVPRLFLSIITFSFVVYMIPGLWGAPLKMISGYVPPMTTQDFDLNRMIVENSGGGGITHKNDLGKRKYTDILHMPTGFEGFYDLEEAKAYAKKVNKPIFVDFTGKTCANCREMENNVWTDSEVKRILNEEYVMVALYADANFIKLAEEDWITTAEGKIIKRLGSKNLNYQITRFNMNAQPYYVLMDYDETVLTEENKAYDKHIPNFIKFLNDGVAEYKKRHK
ncbi:MAG: thioredoxin family protein [Bacteroidales bacterium]|nr:thioredoxin family protein [Bacteroidales bacterium]